MTFGGLRVLWCVYYKYGLETPLIGWAELSLFFVSRYWWWSLLSSFLGLPSWVSVGSFHCTRRGVAPFVLIYCHYTWNPSFKRTLVTRLQAHTSRAHRTTAYLCVRLRVRLRVRVRCAPRQEQKKDSGHTSVSLWDCWFMAELTQFLVSESWVDASLD